MLAPLLDGVRAHLDKSQQELLDQGGFFLPVMRGFVGALRMPSSHPTIGTSMHLAVVSRVGCNRPGAGLRNRGLDDEGNVASFVEVCTTNCFLSILSFFLFSFVIGADGKYNRPKRSSRLLE